ncbi:MAG: hypothetical protein Q9166_005946 [cf. Caloplaca sp. 2 TL-2023]
MREPTYYVLKRRIPSTEEWLGRIFQFYQDPTASYVPSSAENQILAAIQTNILTTKETDFHLSVKAAKESTLRTQLSLLLNIDLLDIVPFGHKAYIIVGLVHVEPCSTVKRSNQTSTTSEHGAQLPVVEIATAAAGVPISLGEVTNVEMEHEKTKSHHTQSSGSSGDTSEIIAFEYRLIRRNMSGIGRKVGYRESVVELKGLTFRSGSNEGSDGDSDDEVDEIGNLEIEGDAEKEPFEELFPSIAATES